jgi:hypothetical protein
MLITDIASTIAASGPNSGTTALLGAGVVVGVVASFCDRVDWLGSAVTSTVPVQPVSVTD